jgi:hypothetical protein
MRHLGSLRVRQHCAIPNSHLAASDSTESKTLAKYPDFRIVLVLMKANTQMNEHRGEGRISIHQLLGKVPIRLPDQKVKLVGWTTIGPRLWHGTRRRGIGRERVLAHRLLAQGPIGILMRNVVKPTELLLPLKSAHERAGPNNQRHRPEYKRSIAKYGGNNKN